MVNRFTTKRGATEERMRGGRKESSGRGTNKNQMEESQGEKKKRI